MLRVAIAVWLSAGAAHAASHRGAPGRAARPPARTCPARCANPPLFATKKPPPLTAVDAEVLKLCPVRAGDRVEPTEVRAFFDAHLSSGAASDQRLLDAVAAAAPWARTASSRAGFLAQIWSGPARRNAFTRVLCGDDFDTDEPGGLHLEARYLDLERKGRLCYAGPAHGGPLHDGKPCANGLCLIAWRGTRGFSCGAQVSGGFIEGQDAIDLLAAGTRAWSACCTGGASGQARAPNGSGARLRDGGLYGGPEGPVFQIWCGERNGRPGIAMFSPAHATPDCGP